MWCEYHGTGPRPGPNARKVGPAAAEDKPKCGAPELRHAGHTNRMQPGRATPARRVFTVGP
jgi:hypothetical protein